jgi:hypothetical protein
MKKPLKIAFAGTSGSGKTTLVTWLSKNMGIKHLNGSAGEIAAKRLEEIKRSHNYYGDGHLNVIVTSAIDPGFGFLFQEAVLTARTEAITFETEDFVTDRSPVDNLVYFSLQAAFNQSDVVCNSFKDRCKDAFKELTHLIYIRPCQPDEVENNGSRIPVRLYQDAVDGVFNNLIQKVFIGEIPANERPKILIINYWDLDKRKAEIFQFINQLEFPLEDPANQL